MVSLRCETNVLTSDGRDSQDVTRAAIHMLRSTAADLAGRPRARNEAAGLDFRPPGGESPREVRDRVMSWLAANAARRETMVVVTHKGVLRAVLSAATGWDMSRKPPVRLRHDAMHRFAVEPGGQVTVQECNVALVAMPVDDPASGKRSGFT